MFFLDFCSTILTPEHLSRLLVALKNIYRTLFTTILSTTLKSLPFLLYKHRTRNTKMSTSTTTQIRGRVAYIFQRNPVVDITPITPDDDTMWAAASMTPEQIQLSGTTHPVWVWANLPDATRKRYPRRISYEALQNFSTAIAASAWSSMIGNQHVYAIDLHVTDYEALTTLLSFIERTIGEDNGHIGSVGIQFKTPFYRYYRETQVAKNNVSSCMFRQYRDCAAAIRRPRKDLQPSSKKPGMALFWKELIIILTEPLNHCPANIRALVVEAEDIGISARVPKLRHLGRLPSWSLGLEA